MKRRLEELRDYDPYNPRSYETSEERRKRRDLALERREREIREHERQRKKKPWGTSFLD